MPASTFYKGGTMTKHYTCPGCGATVEYDPAVHKLRCPFCKKSYSVDERAKLLGEPVEDKSRTLSMELKDRLRESNTIPMHVLQCSACGAELAMSRVETSSFCPYCGNATVATDRLVDYLKPEYIIPFKVTKEEAEKKIRNMLKKGHFVPKEIKNFETERLRGIYIPYWLFDIYHSDEQFWSYNSRKEEGTRYSYRIGDCFFKHMTMEASQTLNDEYSKKLEPYDMKGLKPFDAAYLSGFYSDRFDVNRKQAQQQAVDRAKELFDKEVEETIPGKDIEMEWNNTRDYPIRAEYALLPVWFLTFRYDDEPFTIMVNGQTGKVVGAVPYKKTRTAVLFTMFAAIFIPLLTVAFALMHRALVFLFTETDDYESVGDAVVFYFAILVILFGWSWSKALKDYRQMRQSIALTCAYSTNRLVKERQDH